MDGLIFGIMDNELTGGLVTDELVENPIEGSLTLR